MVRLARVVIPGIAHYVTQRGNGRARTFVGNHDYALYRDLLAEHCRAAGVEVWAWCLMPNHVHLILVPSDAGGCAGRWRASTAAMPVSFMRGAGAPAISGRVGSAPSRWTRIISQRRWSSTRAHLTGKDDGITARAPIRARFPRFACSLPSRMARCWRVCAVPRASADRWETIDF